MKTILLFDPRFPDRRPERLSLEDELASALVRTGIAAAADPAEAGLLAAGAALNAGSLTEVVVQHGRNGGGLARVLMPLASVMVGASLGVLQAIGQPDVVVATTTTFDVRAFGAVADSDGITIGSGTDNSAAFRAAIAAASVQGGRVVFPSVGGKSYRIRDPRLRIAASNVSLDGLGSGSLFFDSGHYWVGRVFFDGYTGANGQTRGFISNVGLRNAQVIGRKDIDGSTAGQASFGHDPLQGSPWTAEGALVMFRGCRAAFCDTVEATRSPNFTFLWYDCEDFTAINSRAHDSVADGFHLLGCRDAVLDRLIAEDLGDDGIAIGAGDPAAVLVNARLSIINSTLRNIGGSIAIYGTSEDVTIDNNDISQTFLAGIKVTPVVGASTFPNFAGTTIKRLTIGKNKFRGIGQRSLSAFSRGQGTAAGILLDGAAGGSIDTVTITAQDMQDVRNAFMAQKNDGSVTNVVRQAGSTLSGLVAGGQGAAAQGGGVGYTIDGSFSDVPVGSTGTATPTPTPTPTPSATLFSDSFNRADVAPAVGALGSMPGGGPAYTGAAAGISSKKMLLSNSGGQVDVAVPAGTKRVRLTFDLADGGIVRILFITGTGQEVLIDTAGQVFVYDSGNIIPYPHGQGEFTITAVGSHILELFLDGQTLTAKADGNTYGPMTNTATLNGGLAKIRFGDGGGSAQSTNRYTLFEIFSS